MAKWLRQWFAKPLFPGSKPGGASIEKSIPHKVGANFQLDAVDPDENRGSYRKRSEATI